MQKKLFSIKSDVLGDGKVTFEWSPRGNYLAATGSKVGESIAGASPGSTVDRCLCLQRTTVIYERTGALYDELHFAASEIPAESRGGPAAQLQVRLTLSLNNRLQIQHDSAWRLPQWDPASDLLAVVPNGCAFIMLWTPNKEIQRVETDFKVSMT